MRISLNQGTKFAMFVMLCTLPACGVRHEQTSGPQEAWNMQNDPLHLAGDYVRQLGQLPREGSLKWAPWPDSYWPNRWGGVAARWRTGESGFNYSSPNLNQLAAMSLRDRSLLSPAEKFDAFRGDFRYSLVLSERTRTNPNAQPWEGLCHGWAQASYLFEEPNSVIMRSANGIDIPFGSSDIKALLSLLQGQYARTDVQALGGRCNVDLTTSPNDANMPECRDVNAGAFHLVLTNQIGIKKQGFVVDITRDQQVWNQPVYSYKSVISAYQGPSPGAARGTVKEAVVRTTMWYTIEITPTWEIIFPNSMQFLGTRTYDYRVELDNQDRIIGGEWLTSDRPDFLWTQGRAPLNGSWSILNTIYAASIAHRGPVLDPAR